ncbi:MAG: aminotransferase class V-fold PLP-dependent enzyme, partial [Actinomycetota bacterium]
VLGGFLAAGILAAIMSSLDSQFLCLGTMFTTDIVNHYAPKPQLTDAERDTEAVRLRELSARLVKGLQSSLADVTETVAPERKVAGAAHVCIGGVESEALLFLLDEGGVCASAASACASGAMDPSHVLAAMGVDREVALGALRLTLGHTTTADDIDRAIDVIVPAVGRLRSGAAR